MANVLSFTLITCNENDEFEVVIEYEAGFLAQCLGGDDSRIERYVQQAPAFMWRNKETGKFVTTAKDLEINALMESMVNSEKHCADLIKRCSLPLHPKRV